MADKLFWRVANGMEINKSKYIWIKINIFFGRNQMELDLDLNHGLVSLLGLDLLILLAAILLFKALEDLLRSNNFRVY